MPGVRFPVTINGIPVVTAPAEIDIITAGQLRTVLLHSVAHGQATIVVDMTGTTFCDSAGFSVLVRAHKQTLAEGGGQIRTVRSGRSPRRAVRCRRGTRIDEHGDPCPCEVVQGLRRRDSRTTHAATTHLLSGPLTSRRLASRANIRAARLHEKRSVSGQPGLPG